MTKKYGKREKHKCKLCDNLTYTTNIYCCRECYNNDHNIIIICKGCGIEKKLPKNRDKQEYCSIKCSNKCLDRKESHKKAQNTLLKKYGDQNPFKIYGYENINIDNKKRGTNISITHNNKTNDEKNIIKENISKGLLKLTKEEKIIIKNKKEETNLIKYGDISALGKNSIIRNDILNKYYKGNLDRVKLKLKEYNLEILEEYDGVKEDNGDLKYYKFKHIPSGNIFIDHIACGRIPVYKDLNSTIGTSKPEKELQEYIKSLIYEDEIIFNNRKLIKGYEIDIFIPKYNLAIEFNGLKWHSENMGKLRSYHLMKTEECEKLGIQLIHIFEDEWKYKKDIIKSKLKNILGKNEMKLYARKCDIREVKNQLKNEFLNNNHIQGEDKSKYKYGLYYKDELISLITFGNLRKITGNTSQEGKYELIRFVTKQNYNVVGGFSKLLSHFIKNISPKSIISFADRRYSQGRLYENNGFNFIKNSPPNYWYMKYYNKREHRYKYRKSELSKLLKNFNPNISEWENMKLNKYDRIWDCGSKKYEMLLE